MEGKARAYGETEGTSRAETERTGHTAGPHWGSPGAHACTAGGERYAGGRGTGRAKQYK